MFKTYGLWFLGALASLAWGLFSIKKAENHTLKAQAKNRELSSKLRQSQLQDRADEAAGIADVEGQEKIDADIKAGKRGKFRDFTD